VQSGIWKFGIDSPDLPGFLARYGWDLVEDVGYVQLAEEYVKPTCRGLKTMSLERVAYARKQGS
jgi:hypothetical protein